jgi:hypothetical protein
MGQYRPSREGPSRGVRPCQDREVALDPADSEEHGPQPRKPTLLGKRLKGPEYGRAAEIQEL